MLATRRRGLVAVSEAIILVSMLLLVAGMWAYLNHRLGDETLEKTTIRETMIYIHIAVEKAFFEKGSCTAVNIEIPVGYRINATGNTIQLLDSGAKTSLKEIFKYLNMTLPTKDPGTILNRVMINTDSNVTIVYRGIVFSMERPFLNYKDRHIYVCSYAQNNNITIIEIGG